MSTASIKEPRLTASHEIALTCVAMIGKAIAYQRIELPASMYFWTVVSPRLRHVP